MPTVYSQSFSVPVAEVKLQLQVSKLEADNARLREALASVARLLETLSTPDDAIVRAALKVADDALTRRDALEGRG